MSYDHEAQQRLNIEHVQNPKAGDYWEEHFSGVLQVVEVVHGIVIVFDQKIDVDESHWKFDETKPKAYTIEEFGKKLRYNSEQLGGKTWADVHPRKTS